MTDLVPLFPGRSTAVAVIVTGAAHLDHVEAQLPDRASTQIIVEPEGKNTAAAIALAARFVAAARRHA